MGVEQHGQNRAGFIAAEQQTAGTGEVLVQSQVRGAVRGSDQPTRQKKTEKKRRRGQIRNGTERGRIPKVTSRFATRERLIKIKLLTLGYV